MRFYGILFLLSAGLNALPVLPDTIAPRDWLVSGPFPAGGRELITGVFDDPAEFRPQDGESLHSSLVQGGYAVCRKVGLDSLGWLNTDYPDVRWDSIQDYYGIAGSGFSRLCLC